MSQVGFGLFLPNGPESPEKRSTFVADCERNLDVISGHFTSAWMADHLQFGNHDMVECWTALTYLAARHPDLQFAHGVLCQSFRNPALNAKIAASFQLMTGGRLIFGIGAGWHEEEYKAYNYPFPAPGVRLAELEEAVQITKMLWTQEESTFEGQHYQIHAARCEPRPDPLPPIVIGGRQPKMLRLIARQADWWDVSGFGIPLEAYPPLVEDMRRAMDEEKRDPATLRFSYSAPCAVASTEEEVKTLAAEVREGRGFVGTPDKVVEQLSQFIDLGVTHFQLSFAGFPNTESIELFINEVMPKIEAH